MSVTSININGTTYPTIAAAREALDAMEEEARWVTFIWDNSNCRTRLDAGSDSAARYNWGTGDWDKVDGKQARELCAAYRTGQEHGYADGVRIGEQTGHEQARELAGAVLEAEAHRQRVVGTAAGRTYWTIGEHERILSLARTIGGAQ